MSDDAGDAFAKGAAAGTTVATTAAAAATAFGVSAAVGSAIPIPLIGTAIGVIVGAFSALGAALSSLGRDSFHPDAAWAASWLLIFHIAPGMLYAGVDTIKRRTTLAAARACRLVRYLRLVAGIVQNHWGLYNPRDDRSPGDSDANPYIEAANPDPNEPFTDQRFTQWVLDRTNENAGDLTTDAIPSQVKTRIAAIHTLRILRGATFQGSGIIQTDMFQASVPGLGKIVRRLRVLAGEQGPDPVLSPIFGDVSLPMRPVPRPTARAPHPDRAAPPARDNAALGKPAGFSTPPGAARRPGSGARAVSTDAQQAPAPGQGAPAHGATTGAAKAGPSSVIGASPSAGASSAPAPRQGATVQPVQRVAASGAASGSRSSLGAPAPAGASSPAGGGAAARRPETTTSPSPAPGASATATAPMPASSAAAGASPIVKLVAVALLGTGIVVGGIWLADRDSRA